LFLLNNFNANFFTGSQVIKNPTGIDAIPPATAITNTKGTTMNLSLGCVIAARVVREKIWLSGDHTLKVI